MDNEMKNELAVTNTSTNEIVLYQPNETIQLEVRLQDETVWLNQQQIAVLFGTQRQAITKHLKNIFESGELERQATCSILELVQKEGNRMVRRNVEIYNLDVIISVGYRVNTKRGIQFRQWANKIIKDYMLKGYAINQRLLAMEERMDKRIGRIENTLASHQEKIDFFVRTSYLLTKVSSTMVKSLMPTLSSTIAYAKPPRASFSLTITLTIVSSPYYLNEQTRWLLPSTRRNHPHNCN